MPRQGKNQGKESVILQAAAELFTEKDFHQVLMEEVALRARVGKGTLYRYFPTKEDLYFATIFAGWDRLREELEEVLREEAQYRRQGEGGVATPARGDRAARRRGAEKGDSVRPAPLWEYAAARGDVLGHVAGHRTLPQ